VNTPAEILVFGPPGGTFIPADYPWASELVITAAGGAASDGTPGTTVTRLFSVRELPRRMRVHCGRGSRDAQGRCGQDGYVIIELYP
jgi:hypothetical protein